MFTPEFYIAAFQNTKKLIVNEIVTDKKLATVANRYIDTQTEFANMLVKNTMDVAKYSYDKLSDCWFSRKDERASEAPYKVEKEAV